MAAVYVVLRADKKASVLNIDAWWSVVWSLAADAVVNFYIVGLDVWCLDYHYVL